ncbi:MAG: hypothetical protein V7K15_28910 [Nostoc sp.]
MHKARYANTINPGGGAAPLHFSRHQNCTQFGGGRNGGLDEIRKISGAVTTGDIWKFLKLEENDIFIDLSNYYIK